MHTNVDFFNAKGGRGEVFNQLSQFSDPGELRPYLDPEDGFQAKVSVYKGGDPEREESYAVRNAASGLLLPNEWKQIDTAILPIAESRLIGIKDLTSMNLTYPLGNGFGTTVLESYTSGDAMEAELSMDGLRRGKGDRVTYGTTYLPIPIVHVDYDINGRVLEVSRRMGNPIDTTDAERATRKVSLKLEQMLFTSTSFTFGGGSIKSYVNYGDRNTGTFTAWTTSGKTGAQCVDDVLSMKQDNIDAGFHGPYILYVPTAYETKLDEDYSTSKGTDTIRDRIKKIGNVMDVKVADTLADGNLVLVQMTKDVVRLVQGMPIQNVMWQTEGKFVNHFKVMTIQVPQIRSDQNGKTGIAHYTTA